MEKINILGIIKNSIYLKKLLYSTLFRIVIKKEMKQMMINNIFLIHK